MLEPEKYPAALAEIEAIEAAGDFENPRYMELLTEQHYVKHILHRPPDQWPDWANRAFEHQNPEIYLLIQGSSELGASGRVADWDRTADLHRITVPTLVIGARYDTMDPEHLRLMADQLPNGTYLYCPDGRHLSIYVAPHETCRVRTFTHSTVGPIWKV